MRPTFLVFLVRALAAAAIVLVITGLVGMISERWTGVFSAFPITLLLVLVILHLTYGPAQVQAIIKNFPAGMGSLLTYVVAVAMSYPRYGVMMGTVMSFLFATGYLAAFFIAAGLRARPAPEQRWVKCRAMPADYIRQVHADCSLLGWV